MTNGGDFQNYPQVQPLTEIPVNQKVVIEHIEPFPLQERLYELGFLPGAEIVIKKIAPLGDPIEVSVLEYKICLRKKDAKNIWVKRT